MAAGALGGILVKLARGGGAASGLVGTLGGPENASKQRLFGPLEFAITPKANNPEAITITNGWDTANIVDVHIPQLNRTVEFHRKGADRLAALFAAWEAAGLMPLVLSFDGSWVPRLIRGSKSTLSEHAFGMAFDINANWNPYKQPPSPSGTVGSTADLAPIAQQLGWRWGGSFGAAYADPMHFELTS